MNKKKNYVFKTIRSDIGMPPDVWECVDNVDLELCDDILRLYVDIPESCNKIEITLSIQPTHVDSIAIKRVKDLSRDVFQPHHLYLDGDRVMFDTFAATEVVIMMKEWQTDTVYATVYYWD